MPVEIIGDNFDWTKRPTAMTKTSQVQSYHWFLLLGVQRRFVDINLPDDTPKADINSIPTSDFLPSQAESNNLENDMIHHIIKTATRYIPALKKLQKCLPSHIKHPYLDESSKKSKYLILDLLDKSENKSEDMISILEHVHENYISHTEGENPQVIKKKVFGGDVLTNERAYSAQLAMLNSATDFEQMKGVIHRPEGFHRIMNLLGVYCICCSKLLLLFEFWFVLFISLELSGEISDSILSICQSM